MLCSNPCNSPSKALNRAEHTAQEMVLAVDVLVIAATVGAGIFNSSNAISTARAAPLTVTDPTADRTITFPNETFTIASFANIVTADGDGSTVDFTVNGNPGNENQIFVFINGVCQNPAADYSLSGTTLTLATAPISGDKVVIRY